jgi:hypothetical protein
MLSKLILQNYQGTAYIHYRRILTLLICIFSVFLVTLGMRNIYLTKGAKPKSRPRAIVETFEKSSEKVEKQAPKHVVLAKHEDIPPAPTNYKLAEHCFINHLPIIHLSRNLIARAPPFIA